MEIFKDDNDVLVSIYFQTQAMQNTFSKFPELLLIDATYKLNNLRMPMYILIIVDGNGESEVIALWMVVAEDKPTISNLMDVFKKHNDTTNTKCIMADKDMVERDTLSGKIPNANLLICLFHTLRTFRREITTEKMNISAAQRVTILELITKMVYAQNETSYEEFYQQLQKTKFKLVLNYFDKNWHGIRSQWVEGLKHDLCHYLNSTNNRLESINQKIKSVVSKYSSVLTFFRQLMKCLDSLALEKDHRAAMVFQKSSLTLYAQNTPLCEYQNYLTPFAFSYIVKQHSLADKIKITRTIDPESYTTKIISKDRTLSISSQHCECGFFKAMQLPCRHIFAL